MTFKTTCAAALLSAVAVTSASASVIMNVQEVGNDVVFSYDGSIDLAGGALRGERITYAKAGIGSAEDIGFRNFAIGGTSDWDFFTVSSFTVAGQIFSGSIKKFGAVQSGNDFGFEVVDSSRPNDSFQQAFLILDHDYVSGSAISGSITFENHSFSSLNLIQGSSLVLDWGSDNVTVNVGSSIAPSAYAVPVAPVPVPASLPLLLAGIGGLGLARRRK